MPQVLIVERFYYNFREGIFDQLERTGLDFKLINSTKSRGRVKVHQDKVSKVDYISKCCHFFLNNNIVIFPFLFFKLCALRPKVIVSEGGQNTINNIHIYLYCLLFRKKYIIWDLGRGYQDFGNSFLRRMYISYYKFIANNSSFLFGYNSGSKKYFLDLGIPEDKIVILNNTVDTIQLKRVIENSAKTMPDDLKAVYQEEKKYAIFVGTLLPTKNIESLQEIFTKLGNDYHLMIVGDGETGYVDSLKQLFKNINCTFFGYKKPEDLLPYYSVASFAILPGLGGLAINQAMAYEVSVICSKADGAETDIVHNKINGYIYENTDDMVKFVSTQDKSDWERMGQAASKILYSDFSLESECDKFIDGVNNCM